MRKNFENVDLLLAELVKTSVEDYMVAYRSGDKETIISIEDFFKSDLFWNLYGLDGYYIIGLLKKYASEKS